LHFYEKFFSSLLSNLFLKANIVFENYRENTHSREADRKKRAFLQLMLTLNS